MFGCYMAWFNYIHWIVALALFLTVEAQDLTLASRPPDVTYVELGKTLTLNVTYETNSKVAVTWIKDGKNLYTPSFGSPDPRVSIKGQATLVLINTTLSDNGTYTNTVATAQTTKYINLIVIIQEQPTAVINCSSPVYVKKDGHFECLCYSTDGNPPPNASWYKDGKVVSGPGYKKTTLSLKNITGNNTGNYSCFVESYDLNDTKSVEIEVLLKPIAMINCSTNVNVKEGDDLECLCYDTRGNPSPRALWYKDGNDISKPEYLNELLSLKNISKEDAGNYSCLVNNTVFEDVKQIEIQVLYKPIIIVFKIINQDKYNVIVGENVTISCQAEGFPQPDYIIFHNGTPLTNVVKGMTTIKSVNYSDDGQYKCIAKNILGNVSASFNLIVQEQPTAEKNCSSPFIVKEGDNFECLCYSSTGYPPPNVTWYNPAGNAVDKTENLKKTLLLLKNITKKQAGNYSCTVRSLDLEDTKQVKLQVQYKPTINYFTSGRENNTATFGQSLSIKCVAEGFPEPNMVIFHIGTKLTGVVNGVKTILSVNFTDAGRYECVVNNSLGNKSASFNLTVKVTVSTTISNITEGLTTAQKVAIAVGSVVFFILLVVLIPYVYKRNKGGGGCRPKKERVESEVDLADHGIPNVAVAVHDNFNAYESVDKEKMKPNEEAGTSGDGEPARIDSPPSMPPVNAVGDKKSKKKKTPPDEEKPASGEDDNAVPAAAPSILPAVYTAVDKVAQQKERDARPDSLTYANLDPVLLQPDSSKMRDRSREDTNYATIDMAKLQ